MQRRRVPGMIDKKESEVLFKSIPPFSDLITSKPLSFYSLYYQLSKEDKDKMYSDSLVKKVQERNNALEKQCFNMDQDLNHLSREVRRLLGSEKEGLDEINQLRQVSIFTIRFT